MAWYQPMESLQTTAEVSVSFCFFLSLSLDICRSHRLGTTMAFLVSGFYLGKYFMQWPSSCLCPLFGGHVLFVTGGWWPHHGGVSLQHHHCPTSAPPVPLTAHMIQWGLGGRCSLSLKMECVLSRKRERKPPVLTSSPC